MKQNDAGPMPKGLTTEQAQKLLAQFGKNELKPEKKESFFHKIVQVVSEPMFLLLIIAAVIYFILGEAQDGAVMLVFVLGIISIDVIQEWKTDKTLKALKDLSAPQIKVIRDGREQTIASQDLVPGDLMLVSEGVKIPADGEIVAVSDLCVDESSLTGESQGVWKVAKGSPEAGSKDYWRPDCCYAGTLALQGLAAVQVKKTGLHTEYGKIGADVASAPDIPTPLQKQTGKLVKLSAGIAAVLFALVSGITYLNLGDHLLKDRIIESILSGITLAMAMIPEEFPVILTVFLSLGAWRLAKSKSLVRRLPSVETLGAVSVLCVDKTGTITMNRMTVQDTWTAGGNCQDLCRVMGMACEIGAYDPMEKAMLKHCESLGLAQENLIKGELVREYPFTNETKMMGHVWKHKGGITVAVKGSPEQVLTLCAAGKEMKEEAEKEILAMSRKCLRVIAVAEQTLLEEGDIPASLADCTLSLKGLVGLADPPRDSIKEDIEKCVKAGIRVVMITGDNGVTASSIAKQIGMPGSGKIITGSELDAMSDEELRFKVQEASIFSRVVPEHKMRIVQAFKANGEIVAMTGDGVNDAPALKYADIGIAMGLRGSEVSREAADLILLDDNFSTIVRTIEDGRRIYDNIKKAVGYVLTIHIPIAFASLLAPLLGIAPALLMLLPLHIVLLELVIDPTCSVVLERQPAEKNIMERAPRSPKEKLLDSGTLVKSLVQGLVILAVSFGAYYFTLETQGNGNLARTMGLVVILLSNLLLVQVNSSSTDSAWTSFQYLMKDKIMWAVTIGTVALLLVILYTPLHAFLKLAPLSAVQLLIAAALSIAAVAWYELVKMIKRFRAKKARTEISLPGNTY